MPDLCTPTFERLAESLGFSCGQAGGLLEFRNPLQLENWTLPVLEITVIAGAVLALVYAIARYRRGDATNLALWFGAIAYLLIIEPPLYFPGAFGIADHVDTMFAHNLFSVEFLWGRLPLYIVAIYPMMATVSFEIVRTLGVFRRYGAVVGAICVGFVHHAFYEIFDHLGPQLRWWEWSVDNPLNQPLFTSVPMGSVVVFAALWPASLALCVQLFVGRQVDQGKTVRGPQLVGRTVAIGVLASLGTGILPLPATLLGAATNGRLIGIAYAAELLVIVVVAVPIMARQWRQQRLNPAAEGRYRNPLMVRYAAVYLAVMGVLWLSALPAYFGAVGGQTADGDPIGSLWYAALCFAVAGLSVAAAATVPPIRKPEAEPEPVAAGH
ncbi:hypothetical protein [Mycolicibacter hiberniae]|uniref:Uncharacterized protein n=1 Tax=Mycolicibacter hiberniae TaxID=29314 RepID=A0A7I7X1M3_9MYCO|nr:hypothetical protein [Mycolicibacter hiberniae]MCV7085360.1 hypothetical protein [Mycolicibacter hiberniae]ORV70314.1 hypothetical protein AWC09_10050 [Mycolicibacter hiberniae]BBZ23065.1 hypothetical protein MHIB_14830 [Mycolicibacter hiberniae]